jgi:hypothetical protein
MELDAEKVELMKKAIAKMPEKVSKYFTQCELIGFARSNTFFRATGNMKPCELFYMQNKKIPPIAVFDKEMTCVVIYAPKLKDSIKLESKKADSHRLKLIKTCLKDAPAQLKKTLLGSSLIGLCRSVSYFKIFKGDDAPYEHYYGKPGESKEMPAIVAKMKGLPVIINYSPNLSYKGNFIYG